jgi:hypothetical protein
MSGPIGADAEHRAQPLLRVAHGHEHTLPFADEREGLGRADRRLADSAFAGDEDEALAGERRHCRVGSDPSTTGMPGTGAC